VEIECFPALLRAASDVVAADTQVLILDVTAGGRDLLATVFVDDEQEAVAYASDRIGALPGVRAVRTHLVTERILDARRWRLRELTPDEISRIPGPRKPRPRAARAVSPELRAVLREELARDGRASAAAIADRHGISAQRVADAIATLRSTGALHLRTDLVRTLSDWPAYTWYFLQVPAQEIARARTTLAQVPRIRLAVLCPSRYNLVLAMWLRDLRDVRHFEVALSRALPGTVVADRSVVVRIVKHLGRLLDDCGRVRSVAPDDSGGAAHRPDDVTPASGPPHHRKDPAGS